MYKSFSVKKVYINENKFKLYTVLFEIIVASIDNPAIKNLNSSRKPEVSWPHPREILKIFSKSFKSKAKNGSCWKESLQESQSKREHKSIQENEGRHENLQNLNKGNISY